MTRDAWVAAHPYLQPVARFCEQVESALAAIECAEAATPDWDDYASDFSEGVPLLQSTNAGVDLEPAGTMVVALIEKLGAAALPDNLHAELGTLAAQLRREADAPKRVLAALLGDETLECTSPGLLRYLGWTAMARYLRKLVRDFDAWRDEERWLRNYCPACGSRASMAQMVGIETQRTRLLVCGCCGTRWRFKRTCCPFCEFDDQRLAVVAIEGEGRLRIDYCESCKGYLKCYVGQGDEAVFLADWTSLHLDLVAGERGLERVAVSLYEVDPAGPHPSQVSGAT